MNTSEVQRLEVLCTQISLFNPPPAIFLYLHYFLSLSELLSDPSSTLHLHRDNRPQVCHLSLGADRVRNTWLIICLCLKKKIKNQMKNDIIVQDRSGCDVSPPLTSKPPSPFCSSVAVALGGLTLWHTILISRGETSVERHINHKETRRLKEKGKVCTLKCWTNVGLGFYIHDCF